MRRTLSMVGLFLAAALIVGILPSRADSPIRILENRYTVHFADKMTFRLVAECDQPIQSVTLYYRRQKESVTSRVIPKFTAGCHVEATFEKSLERGEIPPGTTMEYYWRLELADGTRQDTPIQTFVYEDDRFSWQTVQADNITVLYYGSDTDGALARAVLGHAQSVLTRLQSEVGVSLAKPVRIYIYRNGNDMAAALSPRSEGYDERVLTLGVAVADDTLLLLGNQPSIQQTVAHELSHIVVGLATKNPYSPIPRWLDEGLAMYAEGELPADNAAALQDAINRDALISVRSLSGYTGQASQVDLYYGEVYSLVQFLLRTYGRDKMAQLLQVFQQGTYQEDALQQVYGLSLDSLDSQWRQSLGLQPRSTVGPARVATPQAGNSRSSGPLCPLSSLAGALGIALAFCIRRVGAH